MKFSTLMAGALSAASVLAAPLDTRQSTNIDPVVLQFALTLEHLENFFYKQALQKFSLQDFIDAGYSETYYNNLKYIAFDEQSHVQLLTSALSAAGYAPVAPCSYSFPYTTVGGFITLSSIIEGVGTSAYLAGAPLITSKTYLTVAGSILVAEALHTSYQRAAVGEVPMASPYGTPLDPTAVFTLAAGFITSCPASNMALPFKPFPGLTYAALGMCTDEEPNPAPSAALKKRAPWGYKGPHTSAYAEPPPATSAAAPPPASTGASPPPASGPCAPPSAGASIMLTAASSVPKGSYATFVCALSVVSVPVEASGADISVAIPSVCSGQSYVLITSKDVEGALDDSAVLFGPAIIEVNPAAPALDFGQI